MAKTYMVRFRLRPRLGYSGDLADIAEWRKHRPRDVVRRLEVGFEVTMHLEQELPASARAHAARLLGEIFRPDRYQSDLVELRARVA